MPVRSPTVDLVVYKNMVEECYEAVKIQWRMHLGGDNPYDRSRGWKKKLLKKLKEQQTSSTPVHDVGCEFQIPHPANRASGGQGSASSY